MSIKQSRCRIIKKTINSFKFFKNTSFNMVLLAGASTDDDAALTRRSRVRIPHGHVLFISETFSFPKSRVEEDQLVKRGNVFYEINLSWKRRQPAAVNQRRIKWRNGEEGVLLREQLFNLWFPKKDTQKDYWTLMYFIWVRN